MEMSPAAGATLLRLHLLHFLADAQTPMGAVPKLIKRIRFSAMPYITLGYISTPRTKRPTRFSYCPLVEQPRSGLRCASACTTGGSSEKGSPLGIHSVIKSIIYSDVHNVAHWKLVWQGCIFARRRAKPQFLLNIN